MKVLITGGVGFIGCNVAKRFMDDGHKVIIFDNLSRIGSESNLKWLRYKGEFIFVKSDIRNRELLDKLFIEHREFDVVIHLAAQVAVTTSVTNPQEDFEVNTMGTFNILETIRKSGANPILIFASTNKVYGKMDEIKVVKRKKRYEYRDLHNGVSENVGLDFYSPYGCSKGAADQYIRDYSRIYGLRTVVLRQSCIYGYRQFGVEDQGWVAWFVIASISGRRITIYGDGKQVRDILFIDDLVDLIMKVISKIEIAKGKVYNVGGSIKNSISLLELIDILESIMDKKIAYIFSDWRPGDQKIYVSDIRRAKKALKWTPTVDVKTGVKKLLNWVVSERKEIDKVLREKEG